MRRYAWIDLGAGPFKRTSPSSFASTVNTGERLPRPDAHLHGQQRERADIISYWTSFCRSRSGKILLPTWNLEISLKECFLLSINNWHACSPKVVYSC